LIERDAQGQDCRHATTVIVAKLMMDKRIVRPLVVASEARIAHLRSPGKGANKTPLDEAAWPLACREASGRFARRRQAASPCRCWVGRAARGAAHAAGASRLRVD